jgi:hypothetical protein
MKNYAKALKNKVVDKVSDVIAAPKVKYHESKSRQHNKNANFLKDYNAKKGSRVPISNKEQAQFQQIKSHYSQ